MLVDSHCHLEHPRIAERAGRLIDRAMEAGVKMAIDAGSNLENNKKILELVSLYPEFLKCVLGQSPHDAGEDLDENLSFIKASKNHIIGIGEIGLDYHHFKQPAEHERQKKVFEEQLHLAAQLGLPVVIHSRKAEGDVIKLLEGFHGHVVMHCFMNPEYADVCAERGYFVSIPTVKCRERTETIEKVPLELLVCETDSPFLWKGGVNEPANVKEAYEEVARVKKADFNSAVEQIYSNVKRIFKVL